MSAAEDGESKQDRPALVSLRQAAELTGHTDGAFRVSMRAHPDRWPKPVTRQRVDGAKKPSFLYDRAELLAAAAQVLGPPRDRRPRWSEEELRLVRDLRLSVEQVALRLPGRSERAVGNLRSRLGVRGARRKDAAAPAAPTVRPRRASLERAAWVIVRAQAGVPRGEIASEFGISRSRVSQIVAGGRPVLVTRAEAAAELGYSVSSLATLMNRHPERWPTPVAHRPAGNGRGRVYLWVLDELRAAAGVVEARSTRIGAGSTVSDGDGLIPCLECGDGRRFRHLGTHLSRAHGVTAAEYRAAHGLPATAALAADVTRLRSQEIGRERHAAGELGHLKPWQGPERLREMAVPGIDASAGSRNEQHVRANRRPGQERAVRRMVAARVAKLDEAARQAGYRDLDDGIQQTTHLNAAAAGRAIGVSAQTVRRRRADLGRA